MIGIYKITNPNGKIYIGQSIHIEKRWEEYKRIGCKNQPLIVESLRKYGWFNHIFQVIEECEINELNIKEQIWIKYYGSSINGLNCGKSRKEYTYPEAAKRIKSIKMKKLWKENKHQGRGKKPVKILVTGIEYPTMQDALDVLKISYTKAYKYLGEGIILSYIK